MDEEFETNSLDHSSAMHVITAGCYGLIWVIGVTGNALVVYSVAFLPRMRTVTNLYLLQLAVADCCFLAGLPLLAIATVRREFPFNETLCKGYTALTALGQVGMFLFLAVISGDRYVAVCHTGGRIGPKLRSASVACAIVVCAWLVAAALAYPLPARAVLLVSSNGSQSCVINLGEPGEGLSLTLYMFIVGFATPLCLVALFYGLVLCRLARGVEVAGASRRRVTRLVLVVIAVCVAFWLPYWILQWLLVVERLRLTRVILMLVMMSSWLEYSSAAINPILYGFLSRHYRRSFLLACTRRREPPLHVHNSRTLLTSCSDSQAGPGPPEGLETPLETTSV